MQLYCCRRRLGASLDEGSSFCSLYSTNLTAPYSESDLSHTFFLCRFIDGHVATVVPAAVALLQQARAAAGAASNKQRGGPNAPNPSAEALLSRALGMASAVLLP